MENKVLASISGVEVKESDLQQIIMRYPEDKRAYFGTEEAKKQLLEQFISFELMSRLGAEMKLNETEEYKNNLIALEKDLLTQITINKVLAEVTVTDEESLEYYNNNKESFAEKATVSAKHILVQDEEECAKIRKEIQSKECTFEEAAMKYSSCPSKEQGGSLGDFSRGMMVPEFEDVAFTLDLETVSEPVKTQFGYHLIKVEAKTEGNASEFETVKEQIVNNLIQERQQRKYLDVVKELEVKHGVKRF